MSELIHIPQMVYIPHIVQLFVHYFNNQTSLIPTNSMSYVTVDTTNQ